MAPAPAVAAAVERLSSQLPLAARQQSLTPELRDLHRAILRSLFESGRPPAVTDSEALAALGKLDLVVFSKKTGELAGAYPMTVEQTPHELLLPGRSVYAMCALDAVSVTPMFGGEVEIRSQCRITGEPVVVKQQDERILEMSPASVLVGVRWQMPATAHAAHSMCMEMVFLRDRAAAASWSGGDTEHHAVFELPDAVAFGAAFFKPLV